MATRRRPANKKPETSTGAKEGKVTELKVAWSPDRRLTVTVGTAADFGKIKVGLSLSENVKDSDDPMALADSIFETLTEKLEEQYDALAEKIGLEEGEYEDDPGDDGGDDGDDDWGDEGGDDGSDDEGDGEPEEIDEDDIRKMKKDELLELIEDEQLELDPKDYKKIGELREAVIDALFEEDPGDDEGSAGGEDDPDWDDDDWEDE
jgi:hypothetical protein